CCQVCRLISIWYRYSCSQSHPGPRRRSVRWAAHQAKYYPGGERTHHERQVIGDVDQTYALGWEVRRSRLAGRRQRRVRCPHDQYGGAHEKDCRVSRVSTRPPKGAQRGQRPARHGLIHARSRPARPHSHDARSIGRDLFHPESKATETVVLPVAKLKAWYVSPSVEALAFTAVGGDDARLRGAGLGHVVSGEAFGQLTGLGVPHPDPVADR